MSWCKQDELVQTEKLLESPLNLQKAPHVSIKDQKAQLPGLAPHPHPRPPPLSPSLAPIIHMDQEIPCAVWTSRPTQVSSRGRHD